MKKAVESQDVLFLGGLADFTGFNLPNEFVTVFVSVLVMKFPLWVAGSGWLD